MTFRQKIALGILLIASGIIALVSNRNPPQKRVVNVPPTPPASIAVVPPIPAPEPTEQMETALIGEEILADYLDPAGSARADLILMSHLLISFDTLVKAVDALPLGANGDIADAFRGKNPVQMRFLPDDHKAFSATGELIDRWQSPLYFHAESSDRIAIRSAGPDTVMWTEDDVHLEPDGQSFSERTALLPASLYGDTDQELK
ncbi:MAG: hypothetical protein KDN22_12985 [Verrucomicrobiae bacterium]|nr:hypothetical protein [Verrucomicrobiae bacterium]